MIETVAVVAAAVALTVVVVAVATRKRRRMQRHPAPTFVFADLIGYTALTDQRGDEAAAKVAREFRRTMCALSRDHGAWQVKSMGDGVMIGAPDAGGAVALAARTVEEVGARADLLPVRVGVHTGPAVMRGCDWYGGAVNVAARLAAEAARMKPSSARRLAPLLANLRRVSARGASCRCAASSARLPRGGSRERDRHES